jgi:hypothetical protein
MTRVRCATRRLALAAALGIAGGAAPLWIVPRAGVAAAQEQAVVAQPEVPVLEGPTLSPAPGWPIWIKDYATRERAEKTSDIVFVRREPNGTRDFFLVDEIGLLRWCRVSPPAGKGRATLRMENVAIGSSLTDALSENEIWDFEALALVPHVDLGDASRPSPDSLAGWLSVEGRGARFREQTTVLDVVLRRQDGGAPGPTWRIEAGGETFPGAHFWEGSIGPERGIAGIGVGPRIAYLGLSRGEPGRQLNTAGTILYVYDRTRARVGYVSTRRLGIYSVGGIDAWSDTLSVVLDRERESIFVLRWDAARPGVVSEVYRFPLDLPGPGGFRYAIPQVDGVTVDEAGDFWCVTDPLGGEFNYRAIGAAPESVLVYLAAGIPMLYCFRGEQVWSTVGVTPAGRTGK